MRLYDFGLYGYKNVKALANLHVTKDYEIGEWERRAGYDINGTVRPKKYWIVDMKKWGFIEKPGEVTEF